MEPHGLVIGLDAIGWGEAPAAAEIVPGLSGHHLLCEADASRCPCKALLLS